MVQVCTSKQKKIWSVIQFQKCSEALKTKFGIYKGGVHSYTALCHLNTLFQNASKETGV